MRGMLEPVFGEGGAVVAQFIITLLVVLALVAAVLWLVRRYGGGRFGQAPRSRAPRLALIDALPVDARRRLILVRRDNVEHLLLIGGPTDLVVEPAIRRAPAGARPQPGQMPAQRPGVAAPPGAPAEAPPAPASGGSEPVPFRPQADAPAEAPAPGSPPQRRAMPAAGRPASAHFAETSRPTRIESVFSLADALDEIADEPASSPAAPFEPPGAAPAVAERAATPPEGDEGLPEYLLPAEEPAPAIATEEIAEGPSADTGESASKVSDLEREMARLLGEITSRRGG